MLAHCGQKWECACVAQTEQVRYDSEGGGALAKFLVIFAKKGALVGVAHSAEQNDKEGARANERATCGTRGPLGRGQSLPSARMAPSLLSFLTRQ